MKEKGTKLYDLIIIGGGPAGLAAAVAARESGLSRILLLEREEFLGGVLPQCVHDGFGLHLYGHSLTGPEYAELWERQVREQGITCSVNTTVLSVARAKSGMFTVDAVGEALGGHRTLSTMSVVVATGCRERTRGQMAIPGTRPAGVLTAGTAQYMVNVQNQLPGDKVVILGSGDIGLIMARRFTLEGADVRLVLGQEATGLLRNHIRCIEDFGIPLRYGWGLTSIHGYGQLKGVTVAPMRSDGTYDMSRHEYIRCNVLLIACGLIPEREVLGGCDVNETDGLFVCGNASAPHDLVDQVTQEGLSTGRAAAEYVCGKTGTKAAVLPQEIMHMLSVKITEPTGRMDALEVRSDGCAAGQGRIIPCTICPTGCMVSLDDKGNVQGNRCERGAEFARSEMICPMRLFTGTVRVTGTRDQLLPVRTMAEVPRESLMDVARACRHIRAARSLKMGDIVEPDIAGTGIALVAAADARR